MFIIAAAMSIAACNTPTSDKPVVTSPPPVEAPKTATVTPDTMAKPMITGGSTSVCYQYVFKGKDKHSCQITTRATANPYVSGYFDWSPYEKDGGHGVLKNMRNEKDLLVADFIYMIEGSIQSEEVYFKVENDKLTKMETELVDKGGKLVAKDRSKLKKDIVLLKVDCSVLDGTIKAIKEIESQLK